jgi:hypothetical protein
VALEEDAIVKRRRFVAIPVHSNNLVGIVTQVYENHAVPMSDSLVYGMHR